MQNPDTKKILRALPQDPEPSIMQMVTACTKATSLEQTLAVAVNKRVGEAMVTFNNIQCFNCKQFDHVQATVPIPCLRALFNPLLPQLMCFRMVCRHTTWEMNGRVHLNPAR